jgi:hypothetical protein
MAESKCDQDLFAARAYEFEALEHYKVMLGFHPPEKSTPEDRFFLDWWLKHFGRSPLSIIEQSVTLFDKAGLVKHRTRVADHFRRMEGLFKELLNWNPEGFDESSEA